MELEPWRRVLRECVHSIHPAPSEDSVCYPTEFNKPVPQKQNPGAYQADVDFPDTSTLRNRFLLFSIYPIYNISLQE